MSFTVHHIYAQVFKLWREHRFRRFVNLIKPQLSDALLDVGGYPGFWVSHPQFAKQIDTVNIHAVYWNPQQFPRHNIQVIVGDGCDLKIRDKSYDIGFSNSVIEHMGTWARQKLFASEIRRVAKSLWVQTPAFECPMEPHCLTPFVHYFPRKVQKLLIVRWLTVWGWIQRPTTEEISRMVDTIRLLRKREMQHLFPDCEILTERILWVFPKSYIAIRKRRTT